MKIKLKVGSVVTLPLTNTGQVASSNKSVATVAGDGDGVKVSAIAIGETKLTVTLASGLDVSIGVEVVE